MRGLRLLFAAAFLALAPAAAWALEPFPVELAGVGAAPVTLTPEALRDLPPVEADVTFQASKGPSTGHYAGVLLWDVLKANNAFEGAAHNEELKRTFVVLARDGYEVAFSVGEIHPDFGNTRIMLADRVDGAPIEGGFRVVVPGDTRGARNVREVVKIELR